MLFVVLLASACSKEGPQGPAGTAGTNGTNGTNGAPGAQGPAGPQGPQGNAGTANVIYSGWIKKTNADWVNVNTTASTTVVAAPALTANLLGNGTVLVYMRYNLVVYPLAHTFNANIGSVDFSVVPGQITVRNFIDFVKLVKPLGDADFRYMLIPGGTQARAEAPVDYKDYEAVKAYYNLPE
ncbi:hypothetical protein [Chitinophaga alhagiae]|uniref:hypothetical protein n=1 Tax=Chitinophaga alhagiae TaxID=2203219 RepID=UPI0018E5A77A|nr:hypothetical protein [Chitinophaga alhagiae]